MMIFNNVMPGEEADRLVELGDIDGYELSTGGWTTTNAWCIDDCYADPTARALRDRIANITGVPKGTLKTSRYFATRKDNSMEPTSISFYTNASVRKEFVS
jgi:hypothetical protein